MDERKIMDFLENNRGKILGGVIGLILYILLIKVGFFESLLLVGFVAAGIYFGSKRENWERFVRYLSKLFPDK
jgi:uncharacterized membrane protein